MSAKVKAIISAVLVLLGACFSWYVAYSDGDETTKPETSKVIEAGKEVYNAIKLETETKTESAETVTE